MVDDVDQQQSDVRSPPIVALEELRNTPRSELKNALPLIEELTERFARNLRLVNRLNAYRAIAEFDTTGDVTARAAGADGASLEVGELVGSIACFDVAKRLLIKYLEAWPDHPNMRAKNEMIPDDVLIRDDFRDDPNLPVQIVAKPGVTTTVAVFNGRRHKFGVSLNLLHHCWLSSQNVNVVYLRDFYEALYLRGIESLGASDQDTFAKLREIFASLGTKRLVCLGNSGGVFGAWYYGGMLPAHHVLNFSGPSSLEHNLGEPRKARYYESLRELHAQGQASWPEVRPLYDGKAVTGRVIYGELNPIDRVQAEHMSGLPNVKLEPVLTDKHFVLGILASEGRLADAFARGFHEE